MFQRKPRRFRRRSNGRNHHQGRGNDHMQSRPRPNSFSNGQMRNNFRPTQSAEKLFEKYTSLAKEAISSGDKTSGENYLQHADHFMRIIEDKNRNKENSNTEAREKLITEDKANLEKNSPKQEEVIKNQEEVIKNKE